MKSFRTIRPKRYFASYDAEDKDTFSFSFGSFSDSIYISTVGQTNVVNKNGVLVERYVGGGTTSTTNSTTVSVATSRFNIVNVAGFSYGQGISVFINSAGRSQYDDSYTTSQVFEYGAETTTNTTTTVKTTSSFNTTTSYYTLRPFGTGYSVGTSSKTIDVSSHKSGFSDITKTISTAAYTTSNKSSTAYVDMEYGTVYIPENNEWGWHITTQDNNLTPKFISEIASSFSEKITTWPIYGSSAVPYFSIAGTNTNPRVNIPSDSTSFSFHSFQTSASSAVTITSGSYFPRETKTTAFFPSKTTSASFAQGGSSYTAVGANIDRLNVCTQLSSLKILRSLYPTNIFGSSSMTIATIDTYLKEKTYAAVSPTYVGQIEEDGLTANYRLGVTETFLVQFRTVLHTSPSDSYLVNTPPSNNFASPNDICKKPYNVSKFGSNLEFSNQTIYYPFVTGILQGILIPFDGISSSISPDPKKGTWKYSWFYNSNGATLCYSNTMASASTTSTASSGVFSVDGADAKSYYSFNNASGFGGYPDFSEKSVTAFLGKKAVYGVNIDTAGGSTTYRTIRESATESSIRENIRYEQTVPAYLGFTTAVPFPNYTISFSRNNTD